MNGELDIGWTGLLNGDGIGVVNNSSRGFGAVNKLDRDCLGQFPRVLEQFQIDIILGSHGARQLLGQRNGIHRGTELGLFVSLNGGYVIFTLNIVVLDAGDCLIHNPKRTAPVLHKIVIRSAGNRRDKQRTLICISLLRATQCLIGVLHRDMRSTVNIVALCARHLTPGQCQSAVRADVGLQIRHGQVRFHRKRNDNRLLQRSRCSRIQVIVEPYVVHGGVPPGAAPGFAQGIGSENAEA
ncbi:hypothetical protein D3C73_875240 [compost metagenome]